MNWKIQQQTSPNLNTESGNRLREEKGQKLQTYTTITKDLTFMSSDLCKRSSQQVHITSHFHTGPQDTTLNLLPSMTK